MAETEASVRSSMFAMSSFTSDICVLPDSDDVGLAEAGTISSSPTSSSLSCGLAQTICPSSTVVFHASRVVRLQQACIKAMPSSFVRKLSCSCSLCSCSKLSRRC